MGTDPEFRKELRVFLFSAKILFHGDNGEVKLLKSGLILLLVSGASVEAGWTAENLFPELAHRANWDRGCLDWPKMLFPGTREANPALLAEKGSHEFRFQAKLILERLQGESVADFHRSIDQIVRSPELYREWVLPGINVHPENGSYFVEVQNLVARKLSETSFDLTGPFSFNLFWIKKTGTTTVQFRVFDEVPPSCELFGLNPTTKRTLLRFRMLPRPDLLDWMIGEVWFVASDSQIELRLRTSLKPYRPIFELMPLSLVSAQLKFRSQRILENLIEFRKNRALRK